MNIFIIRFYFFLSDAYTTTIQCNKRRHAPSLAQTTRTHTFQLYIARQRALHADAVMQCALPPIVLRVHAANCRLKPTLRDVARLDNTHRHMQGWHTGPRDTARLHIACHNTGSRHTARQRILSTGAHCATLHFAHWHTPRTSAHRESVLIMLTAHTALRQFLLVPIERQRLLPRIGLRPSRPGAIARALIEGIIGYDAHTTRLCVAPIALMMACAEATVRQKILHTSGFYKPEHTAGDYTRWSICGLSMRAVGLCNVYTDAECAQEINCMHHTSCFDLAHIARIACIAGASHYALR